MFKKLCLIAFIGINFLNAYAQELVEPAGIPSRKKISYVTLKNGTEIQGKIKKFDQNKRFMIEGVSIVDEKGKETYYKPEDIQFMYLPQREIEKLSKEVNKLHDATKWKEEKLNHELIKEGYAYYESSKVIYKEEEVMLLMQLLNPSFCSSVKLYSDPRSKVTTGVGYGGIKVSGGDLKSYFIKFGDEPAFQLEKSDYKKMVPKIYAKCDKLVKLKDINWLDLTKHIKQYTECIKK